MLDREKTVLVLWVGVGQWNCESEEMLGLKYRRSLNKYKMTKYDFSWNVKGFLFLPRKR